MNSHANLPTSASRAATTRTRDDNCRALFVGFVIISLFYFSLRFVADLIHTKNATISNSKYPKLEINSISVSNFNLSNPISAHWNINMDITKFHRNDISFNFNDIKLSIFHESKNEALWMMSLKPFVLSPKNPTVHFALDLWGSSAEVDDTTVKAIVEKINANHGVVRFKVAFHAWAPEIRFKHWIETRWWITNINMLVSSCDVDLLFGTPDKTQANMLMMYDSHACTLNVY